MYCNKVKKGKHCITYMLQLNLTKLNLDRSSFVRRSSVVKTLPYSGYFTACMSAHFHVVKLGYADRMTHCGMVPNGWLRAPPQTPQFHLGMLTCACLLRSLCQLGPDGPCYLSIYLSTYLILSYLSINIS